MKFQKKPKIINIYLKPVHQVLKREIIHAYRVYVSLLV